MPDHFDRLVAKGGPGGDLAAGVRVRPRLPGPFERITALGPAPTAVGEASAVPGGRPLAAPLPRTAPDPTARAGAPRATAGDDRPSAVPALPLPRPPLLVAPAIAPAAVSAAGPVPRVEAARPAAPPPRTARPATAVPLLAPPRATAPEPPLGTPPAPARPAAAPASGRRASAAAAPGQAPGTGARRRQRPVERVVRIQIGRVEVRAAERAPVGPRGPAATRPAPSVDLTGYLTRDPS
ncbi:hypothetical protein ACFVFS_13225 [Kitasatospora sp. NPDC057692]|uniref:hypothetical protein n=1 Tax=Kitasatospora sp. NPDC057692 TaxID=3346215 RepID=UPI0036BC7C3C